MAEADRRCVFEARGLTKVYRSGDVEVMALRGLDLDLYAGEFAVFLGPSGSGKSTLFNILGGLDRATGGSAKFEGQELTTLSERELTQYRRRNVGFVFQFYNLVPSLTARENVALVTEIAERPMSSPRRGGLRRVRLAKSTPCPESRWRKHALFRPPCWTCRVWQSPLRRRWCRSPTAAINERIEREARAA